MNTTLTHSSITVLGAGSFGTALAIAFSRNGHPTYLWGHNPQKMQKLNAERQNAEFLPDIIFPEALSLEADLAKAIQASRDLLLAVPSHCFGDILSQIRPHLRPDSRIIWATKGLERDTGRLLEEVFNEKIGKHNTVSLLSGPTI